MNAKNENNPLTTGSISIDYDTLQLINFKEKIKKKYLHTEIANKINQFVELKVKTKGLTSIFSDPFYLLLITQTIDNILRCKYLIKISDLTKDSTDNLSALLDIYLDMILDANNQVDSNKHELYLTPLKSDHLRSKNLVLSIQTIGVIVIGAGLAGMHLGSIGFGIGLIIVSLGVGALIASDPLKPKKIINNVLVLSASIHNVLKYISKFEEIKIQDFKSLEISNIEDSSSKHRAKNTFS